MYELCSAEAEGPAKARRATKPFVLQTRTQVTSASAESCPKLTLTFVSYVAGMFMLYKYKGNKSSPFVLITAQSKAW